MQEKSQSKTEIMSSKAKKAVTVELFPILSLYCPDFNGKSASPEMLEDIACEYASRLAKHGIGLNGMRYGIEHLKERSTENKWTPNPEEFALMCKPTAKDLGIPDLESTITEITRLRADRFPKVPHTYSHPLVKIMDSRIGYNLYLMSEDRFHTMAAREYKFWLEKALNGELPPERAQITGTVAEPKKDTKEPMPEHLKGINLDANTDFGRRIAAMRVKAAARGTTP